MPWHGSITADFSSEVIPAKHEWNNKSISPTLLTRSNTMTSTDTLLKDRNTRSWVKFGQPWTKHSLSLFLALVGQGYHVNEISRALRCSSSQVVMAAKKYSLLLQA
jgi:hypothetical protein